MYEHQITAKQHAEPEKATSANAAQSGGGAGGRGLRLEEAPEQVVEEEADKEEEEQVVEQPENAEHGLRQQVERREQVHHEDDEQHQEAHTQEARVRAIAPDVAPRVPHDCRYFHQIIEKLSSKTTTERANFNSKLSL